MQGTSWSSRWRAPRWMRTRRDRDLTPEERRNLQASRVPVAVVTASLGGHAYNYRDRV
ncbi:hypothetical protein [Gordonia terrae]|nr:hypothetical protein [Gordonia terrae]